MARRARVALVRTQPATILDDVRRVLALLHASDALELAFPTILFLQRSRAFPMPGANTFPWQLEAVSDLLRAAGCPWLAWHSATPVADPLRVRDLNAYGPICASHAIEQLPTEHGASRVVAAPAPLLRHFPAGVTLPDPLHERAVLLLPTLQLGGALRLSGATLLAAQVLPVLSKQQRAGLFPEALAAAPALLAAGCEQVLTLLDASTILIYHDRNQAHVEVRGLLLASRDPLAVDAVAARLVGLDPLRDIAYLRLAYEHNLGAVAVSDIELLGETDLAALATLQVPKQRITGPARSVWQSVAGLFRPVVSAEQAMYKRWSLADRQLFDSWIEGSGWGALFRHYQRDAYRK